MSTFLLVTFLLTIFIAFLSIFNEIFLIIFEFCKINFKKFKNQTKIIFIEFKLLKKWSNKKKLVIILQNPTKIRYIIDISIKNIFNKFLTEYTYPIYSIMLSESHYHTQ